ncbi:MAG: Lrp/AsnC family transcriptional regulator [Bacteroidota bacterium]
MNTLDTTDWNILKLLQQNARMTIKEIAAQLNLSTTPIFDRMKRLEREKVIDRYVAIVDPKKIGKTLFVFAHISLKEHGTAEVEAFVDQVTPFAEVLECYHIAGDADFVLKVVVDDVEAYNQFVLKKLSLVKNVGKVTSRFCLSVRKSTTVLPIEIEEQ